MPSLSPRRGPECAVPSGQTALQFAHALTLCSKLTMVEKPFFIILTKAAPPPSPVLTTVHPLSLLTLHLPASHSLMFPQHLEDARM